MAQENLSRPMPIMMSPQGHKVIVTIASLYQTSVGAICRSLIDSITVDLYTELAALASKRQIPVPKLIRELLTSALRSAK